MSESIKDDFSTVKYSYEAVLQAAMEYFSGSGDKSIFAHLNREKIGRVMYLLSTYGWYVDDFSSGLIFNRSLRFLYSNLPEKMDAHLVGYYKGRLNKIELSLSENFPHRKLIFREAFESFDQGMFFSCINLLLPQVDGMCYDTYKAKFFLNKKKNKYLPEVEGSIQKSATSFSEFLLSPLSKKSALNSHEDYLDSFPVRLNRHEILHGKDVEYGSHINALKIISFASYMNYILNFFRQSRISLNWEC